MLLLRMNPAFHSRCRSSVLALKSAANWRQSEPARTWHLVGRRETIEHQHQPLRRHRRQQRGGRVHAAMQRRLPGLEARGGTG